MSIETIDPRAAREFEGSRLEPEEVEAQSAARLILLLLLAGALWAGFAGGLILGHWVWVR